MGGACGTYRGQERHAVFLWGQPEGKRPLGRTRHGWEVNITMDLKEIGFRCVDWIDVA